MNDADVRAAFAEFSDMQPLGDPAGQKVVYKCRRPDGSVCVLKLVPLPTVVDEDSEADYSEKVARLRREIEILSAIASPHVTRLLDPAADLILADIAAQPCAYYFEVLVDGPSVAGLLEGGRTLTPEVVARLGAHVATAVSEFWSRGKVHRDVKPANIMHDTAAQGFVLLDAGIALDLAGPSLTQALAMPGTLPYLSPERLDLGQKRRLDFRSDLYSMGVVMYEALSGRHPYFRPGMSSQEDKLQAIAQTPPEAPGAVSSASAPVWAVVMRLLEKQPHARYRSCQIVVQELDHLY